MLQRLAALRRKFRTVAHVQKLMARVGSKNLALKNAFLVHLTLSGFVFASRTIITSPCTRRVGFLMRETRLSRKNKKWPAPKIRLCPIGGDPTSSDKERKSLRTMERGERISVGQN